MKTARFRILAITGVIALAASLGARPAVAGESHADLARARAAFDESDFDAAADAYQQAIDRGHLAPSELAEAFVRVGLAFASQGKSKKALDAFRLAVIVDAAVAFPVGGPKKAKPLLEQARREMARRTLDWLRVALPERPAAVGASAATVRVWLVAVAGLEAIEVEARCGEGEPWIQRLPIATEVPVVLPRTMHVTGRVRLRVAAIDDVGNRWGEIERTIDVERLAAPDPAPTASVTEPAPRKKRRESAEAPRPPAIDAKVTAGASAFWATPWPWVAIGTAVLGIGGAYTFALLDASGPARVGPPTVTPGP